MKLPIPASDPPPGARGSSLTRATDRDNGNPYPYTIRKNLSKGQALSTLRSTTTRNGPRKSAGTLNLSPGQYNTKTDASGAALATSTIGSNTLTVGSNLLSSVRVHTPGKKSAAFRSPARHAPTGARYVQPETAFLSTPNCQYVPPSSCTAQGTCVSISKLKRFGTKHFPDAKIQNGFRTGLLTEETSLPDRYYNIDTGPMKSIGTAATDNRAKTSHQFRSKTSRVDDTPPPTKLAPGEYHKQLSFEDIHAMSFARDADGGPAGSSNFASNASRLHVVKRAAGFPRPMLSLDAEEARSGWTGDRSGTTVSESDRWKGGVFDVCEGKEGPEIVKDGKKNFVQRVAASPIRYSDMTSPSTRTIGKAAFSTKDGMRTGCNASTKPPTSEEIGPGYYSLKKPSAPGAASPSASFASSIPRFFVNVHPKLGGNTIGANRKSKVSCSHLFDANNSTG